MERLKTYFRAGCWVVTLAVVGGAVWLLCQLWLWAVGLDPDILIAWALAATLALPLVAFSAWVFGRREANIKVDGLDLGVEKVAGMAVRVADIRDRSASKVRPPTTQIAIAPQLPAPPIVHLESPKEETVDL